MVDFVVYIVCVVDIVIIKLDVLLLYFYVIVTLVDVADVIANVIVLLLIY